MNIASRFLARPDRAGPVHFTIDGAPATAQPGDTVAAALLAHSGDALRHTAKGDPRTPYCMMGVCFECLVEINGVPNSQACLIEVHDGMTVRH